MTKRIRRASELPDWYKLEKYKAASKLDAAGWYEQLSVRRDCFKYLKMSFPDFSEALDIIHISPIFDIDNNPEFKSLFLGGPLWDFKDKQQKPHYSLGVHGLTVRQLRQIEDRMLPERKEHSRLWWNQFKKVDIFNNTEDQYKYEYKAWIDNPIYESFKPKYQDKSVPVMVDLNVQDKLLVESFKQWLKNTRKETHTEITHYKKIDFESWIKFGVLPWLDLTIWQQAADISIPNRVMADAIYPTGEGGEEAVRKTTKPLANNLIGHTESSEYSLSSLAAQAAHELFAKKPEQNNT